MLSFDKSVNIEPLKAGYYTATFNTVPFTPFAIMLFAYRGEISPESYTEHLEMFNTMLDVVDPNSEANETYAKTLLNGELREYSVVEISKLAQEENSENLVIYAFLGDYFKLNFLILKSISPEEISFDLENNYADREVYFILLRRIPHPILKQDTDGAIRVYNRLL